MEIPAYMGWAAVVPAVLFASYRIPAFFVGMAAFFTAFRARDEAVHGRLCALLDRFLWDKGTVDAPPK